MNPFLGLFRMTTVRGISDELASLMTPEQAGRYLRLMFRLRPRQRERMKLRAKQRKAAGEWWV